VDQLRPAKAKPKGQRRSSQLRKYMQSSTREKQATASGDAGYADWCATRIAVSSLCAPAANVNNAL